MATVTLGNIKFNWKGAWNSATAYVVDDVVSLSGSSYVCIQAGTNQNPASATAYWEQMSSAGTNGTDLTTTLTTQGDIVYRDGSGLARLAAGTSGQVLQTGGSGANPSWADAAVGGAISTTQIDQNTSGASTTRTTFTNTSFAEVLPSAMRLVITPASTSSKFYISFSALLLCTNACYWTIFRKIGSGSFTDIISDSNNRGLGGAAPDTNWGGKCFTYIDAPNTTSQVTYAMYSRVSSGTGYVIDNGGEMTIFNALEL